MDRGLHIDWPALWRLHGGVLLRGVPSISVLVRRFGGRMLYVSVPPGCDPDLMAPLFDRCVRSGLCIAFPEFVIHAGGFDTNGSRGDAWRDWSAGLLAASSALLVPDVPGAMVSATVWADTCRALNSNRPVFVMGAG